MPTQEQIDSVYETLRAALQTLNDAGEDITLVQFIAANPQYVKGKSCSVVSSQGQWRVVKEENRT